MGRLDGSLRRPEVVAMPDHWGKGRGDRPDAELTHTARLRMDKNPKVTQKARELQSVLDEAGIDLEIYIGTKPTAVEAMKVEALMRIADEIGRLADATFSSR